MVDCGLKDPRPSLPLIGRHRPDPHIIVTMAESIQLSDVAVVACLAAPHLLYAYIWYFPQQWLAAFKKQSVWVFEAVAWALKGEPPRRSRARTADPPLPLFGRSVRWPPPRRGSVPVGVLLVPGGQPGGAQPGGSPPPGVGRDAAAGWRRPGAPLLPPAARRLSGAAAALVRSALSMPASPLQTRLPSQTPTSLSAKRRCST